MPGLRSKSPTQLTTPFLRSQKEAKQKGGVPLALAQLRHLIRRTLRPPPALREEAAAAAEAAGLIQQGTWTEDSTAWESAWAAICQVDGELSAQMSLTLPRSLSIHLVPDWTPARCIDRSISPAQPYKTLT